MEGNPNNKNPVNEDNYEGVPIKEKVKQGQEKSESDKNQ